MVINICYRLYWGAICLLEVLLRENMGGISGLIWGILEGTKASIEGTIGVL